jgi:hypothetical protein
MPLYMTALLMVVYMPMLTLTGASDPITHKSTTGYLVKLAGTIFSWNSHAQKTITLSSAEAEYMSLVDTSKQLI